MEQHLDETYFLDWHNKKFQEAAQRIAGDTKKPIEKAKALYLFVRDGFRYNPFDISFDKHTFRASYLIELDHGMCIHKAIILAALCRAQGIPTRLGFCDVRNHLATPRMNEVFKATSYNFHGYVSLFLDGRWCKATPAFNKELCEKLGVDPLEFDGRSDSIFQECDRRQKKFMEYLKEYGEFDDLPYDLMVKTLVESYPHLFDKERGLMLSSELKDKLFGKER